LGLSKDVKVRILALNSMLLAIGVCACAGIWPAWSNPVSMPLNPEAIHDHKPSQLPFHYVGSPSCNNQSCHGNPSSKLTGHEHHLWTEQDPHAKSLRVLYNEDSSRISRNLRKINPSRPEHAYEDASCLSCHAVTYSLPGEKQAGKTIQHVEAVSCEACHGPAQHWLAEHLLPSWKTLPNDDKKKSFGFHPTKNIAQRIDLCVSCHIGSADKEVNHDLIAAGHPRLAYEYTRFHYAPHYGKHWNEREPNPDFEIRAWLVGQTTAMRQVIALLQTRLKEVNAGPEASDGKTVSRSWPELSELSCFACHQSIGKERPRSQSTGPVERLVGTPGWNLWYFALLDVLERQTPRLFSGARQPTLTNVKQLLKRIHANPNDKAEILRLSILADEELKQWQLQLQGTKVDAAGLLQVLHDLSDHVLIQSKGKAGESLRDYDWDYLVQHYLACAAMVHARGDVGGDKVLWNQVKQLVKELQEALKYPDDPESVTKFNSPRDYDPETVKKLFQKLRQLTAPPEGDKR